MKPMKDYEGIYSITEDGKVWSHRKNIFIEPKIYNGRKSLGYRLYKNSSSCVLTIDTLLKMNFPKELPEFKYIVGYEEAYGISKDGRLWSYNSNKLLSPHRSKTSAYLYIDLYKNNRPTRFSIHRLVALTYVPNPDNLPEVDHIDRDIYNNNSDNLRWTTRKDNLLNTEVKFLRNFINCSLYYQGNLVDTFKSKTAASKYAHKKFKVSFSGLMRNMHSGSCELKCND